jgi:hypothetical protein
MRECVAMPDHNPATEELRNLIQELHTHMRHNMALWVQWFTFFVGVNYLAFGWFAVSDRNKLPTKSAVLIAACLFISQCALGIWVSLSFMQWLKKADLELFGLYKKLHAERIEPTFSTHFYGLAITLGSVALGALIIGWLALVHWLPPS